ncbi:MAG: DUF4349 domain-containing protein [Coriobacteriia bacterium]
MSIGHAERGTALAVAAALLAVVLGGCTLNEADQQSMEGYVSEEAAPLALEKLSAATPPPSAPISPGTEDTPARDRLIIRTQTMRLEVDSTPEAVTAVRGLADQHQAVITDLRVATDDDQWVYRYDQQGYLAGDGEALRGWVTMRVPADVLPAFVADVLALGTVEYQFEDTDDVTQQHVDLSARLENLRVQEQRLRSFFDAAETVQDMLAIEAELSRIRGEIESFDAQVRYLERQAAMATVTVELTEDRPVVRPDGASWGFEEAVTSGFRGAATVVNFAIAFFIATAPLWALGLIGFFVVRAIVRRRRVHRGTGPEA